MYSRFTARGRTVNKCVGIGVGALLLISGVAHAARGWFAHQPVPDVPRRQETIQFPTPPVYQPPKVEPRRVEPVVVHTPIITKAPTSRPTIVMPVATIRYVPLLVQNTQQEPKHDKIPDSPKPQVAQQPSQPATTRPVPTTQQHAPFRPGTTSPGFTRPGVTSPGHTTPGGGPKPPERRSPSDPRPNPPRNSRNDSRG
jgi:hypothetical protein